MERCAPSGPTAAGHPAGFTLVEMLVVIAIIGILASIVLVRYSSQTDQAKVAAAKVQIKELSTAVISFKLGNNRLPKALDELVKRPPDCPNWPEGGYLASKSIPKDPWGHEYLYRTTETDYEIICLGADGREGGTGVNRDLWSNNLDGEQ